MLPIFLFLLCLGFLLSLKQHNWTMFFRETVVFRAFGTCYLPIFFLVAFHLINWKSILHYFPVEFWIGVFSCWLFNSTFLEIFNLHPFGVWQLLLILTFVHITVFVSSFKWLHNYKQLLTKCLLRFYCVSCMIERSLVKHVCDLTYLLIVFIKLSHYFQTTSKPQLNQLCFCRGVPLYTCYFCFHVFLYFLEI